MADINTYANELLLDFCDAAHTEFVRLLKGKFGDEWLERGVRKHFKEDYFIRVENMLRSPMRTVEMDRNDDEMFGIEHLWNIVNGNWRMFKPVFEDKIRTQAYLGEITELRHNLAHRRKRHCLLKSNLVRIIGSCQIILSALKSPQADAFDGVVNSLSTGSTPWGPILDGQLPASDEMYAEFIGRPSELSGLSEWLTSDSPQILVWGYGGVGKSALAYKFARDVRDSSNKNLIAVCWVSAKRSEYSEGTVRTRPADFTDMESFLRALWTALYGPDEVPKNLESSRMIQELLEMPILLVVDDFDTISEDVQLTEFLLYQLRSTCTRVIYTSRHRVPTLKNLEVPPFSKTELKDFVSQKSSDYSVDQTACIKILGAIESVTGGYPLFVDDLIHHAAFFGIDEAVRQWTQKKGDAARQYALQRQVKYLSSSSGDVLIALSVANKGLSIVDISDVAGLTVDDTQAGIDELLRWRMVYQVRDDDSEAPVFRMNNNTSRLVQQTFRNDGRMKTFSAALRALTGEHVTEAKKAAIGKIIGRTMGLLKSGGFKTAIDHLNENMTGELEHSPDLFSVLGRLHSNQQPLREHVSSARNAFHKAHQLGASKVETYFYWASMERNLAEEMRSKTHSSDISDEEIAKQWKRCEEIAEMGIKRCGPSQPIYYLAGYGASREAKVRMRASNFSYAEGAYTRSVDWYKKSLTAPVSDITIIDKGFIYRGLTLAYEGLRDTESLKRTLKSWHALSRPNQSFARELQRLAIECPTLREDPEFNKFFAYASL